MKILLVTGRNAVDEVKRHIEAVAVPVKIHVCEVDVAAFLSLGKILEELLKLNLGDISQIIVPGTVGGDMSPITRDLGIPCVKGPRNIADLPLVLKKVSEDGIKLSPQVSADDFLKEEFRSCMMEELNEVYNPKPDKLRIGGKNPVFLGAGISHVIAEIPDAPLLTGEELKRIAGYYLDSGAEVIDIGMICGRDDSDKIGEMIRILRSTVDIPLSIDSLDEREILAAVDAGVDLILSIDLSNYELMDSVNVPAVLIPRNEKGVIPKGGDARISLVEELMKKVDKGIVDLILDPVNLGFTGSIEACIKFRRKHPEMPMMLGAGNITELLDADSVGVNALLAGIASELDIDLIFTTEASVKTRGSVKELSSAVKLMYLSKKRSQPPKDLGIDLLVLKDKRRIEDAPPMDEIPSIGAVEERDTVLEDAVFRIYLTDAINVVYYTNNKPELKFSGDSAKKIYQEIIKRSLITNLEHAAYLGKELGKAEIALKLGKNYVQDEDLF
jgi:dihydropteroate synthase-like protein